MFQTYFEYLGLLLTPIVGLIYHIATQTCQTIIRTPLCKPTLDGLATEQVRVLCANACVLAAGIGFSSDGDDRKVERLDYFAMQCDQYDICCFQEVWGSWWSSQHTYFVKQCLQRGFYVAYTSPGGLLNCGNVICSRYPIVDAKCYQFSNTEGWQRFMPNGVLYASIDCKGTPFHVFTTHLHSSTHPDPTNWSNQNCALVRRKQCKELKRFIDQTVANGDPWIVTGDFNINAPSEEYSDLCSIMHHQSALEQRNFPRTFNDKSFLAPRGWRSLGFDMSLDHVFSNKAIGSLAVLENDMSDHYSLTMTLDLA